MIANADAVLEVALVAHRSGRTVVFDLDNTLYPEADFLLQAYDAFARDMAADYPVDPVDLAAFMAGRLRAGGRGTLLQDLCPTFDLPAELSRERLWNALRARPLAGPLTLFPWADAFLKAADPRLCAIVTNGHIDQQKNKLAHLPQLRGFPAMQVVFANAVAPKPAPDAARYLEDVMPCNDPLYIGEAPSDKAFAEAAGWEFFQVDFCEP